ncbi:MAG: hypothetical protein IT542_12455 [Rubellimicrobium sp.]|nr:hypothetical protein [Rubellimicrobium sp.]
MKTPTIRIVIAAILDFILAFGLFGWIVASVTGGLTEGGFSLSGWPAVLVFVLIAAYFLVLPRVIGGTVFQWVFGIVAWKRRNRS